VFFGGSPETYHAAGLRWGTATSNSTKTGTTSTEIGLDHCGRYRDTFVPVGDDWLIKHRFVSTDWVAPNSTMANSSADTD
jgi:hypothetical protein